MKLIIKVSNETLPIHSGEFDLDSNRDIEGHLNYWHASMKAAMCQGYLRIGYYSFGENDNVNGTFHCLADRAVN